MMLLSSTHAVGDVDKRTGTAVFALIGIAIVIGSYVINAMDRTLFPLILPEVRREFGFNLPEAGLMSTIFTVGMALAGLPTGYLMSRYTRKSVVQTGIFIFSAATLFTVWASGFTDMLFYRALTGIGEAMQLTALLAIVSSYFGRYGAVGIGAVNCAYGVGAVLGPLLGTAILSIYGTWRAPMIGFGIIGFAMMLAVAFFVRPPVSEAKKSSGTRAFAFGGAQTLRNRNTLLLVLLSCIAGLAIFGFLGMYPTYLREQLHFTPADTGKIMSVYGLGVLVSVGGGLVGDRFPVRGVLAVSFLIAAGIGWLLFNGPADFTAHAALAFAFGVVFSGSIYVNLAAYHVRAVDGELSGRASGIFVTSFYAAASVAGYAIGGLAARFGWTLAGDLQLCAMCLAGIVLALGLNPDLMARHTAEPADGRLL
jgi:MFS transporter, DHA1 family, inner membrane transport protein